MAPTRRNSPRRRPSPVATPHVDLEYPSSVPTFTVNPTQLSTAAGGTGNTPLPWFSAFGREDNEAPLPNAIDPKYSDPAYYASSNAYGRNGRNSSHTAKKPAGHIKRPPNCFLLFRSHVKESGTRIPEALRPLIKKRLNDKKKKDRIKKGGSASDDEDTDDDDDDEENDEDEQSVSKISGILWDFLPPKEKSFFRARAAHAKAQHKRLFPDYKYSPQAKDKNVKKRTGKKMAVEKRQRLEEVAGVLVQNMGWASSSSSSGAPVKREHSSAARSPSPGPASNVPGTGAFSVPEYEHQPPAAYPPTSASTATSKPRSVPSTPTPHDQYGVPMGLGVAGGQYGPSSSYAFPPPQQPVSAVEQYHYQQPHAYSGDAAEPRMHRRTSSCPPPNAHLTWTAEQPQQQQGLPLPHVYGQQQQQPQAAQGQFTQGWGFPQPAYNGFTSQSSSSSSNFAFPAPTGPPPLVAQPQPPINGTYVRPGGKTIRKMRTGAPTAKQQLLNGGGGSNSGHTSSRSTSKGASVNSGSKKQVEASNTGSGGMMLPSLPTVMRNLAPQQQQLMSTMVPMTTTGSHEDAGNASSSSIGQWNGFANYDLSQHSSPATFSSSSNSNAPSVLETPPFNQHLPQLAYTPQFDFSGTMAGQQQQYGIYQDQQFHAPTPEAEAYSTPKAAGDHQEDGNLGLTFIDQSYTFPHPAPSPAATNSPAATVRATSPAKSNSAPQPQRASSGRWTNKGQSSPLVKSPYPTSGRKVPRLQMASASSSSSAASAPSPSETGSATAPPFTPSSATLSPSLSLVSPTPVTPIPPMNFQQQHAHQSYQQQLEQPMRRMGLEDLGVELNLNIPPGVDVGEIDQEHLGGLLEYAFPAGGSGHEYMNSVNGDGSLRDGFNLGAAGGNVLLGDAALGMHDQEQYEEYQQDGHRQPQQQQYLPVQQLQDGVPFAPLDVPLEALYEGTPNAPGPVMETVSFDPSLFIDEAHGLALSEEVDLSAATAEESQLEFQMMEWRRGSGGSTSTVMAPTNGPNMSRRASIGVGATMGPEAGSNLYGFNPNDNNNSATSASSPYHQDTPHNYEISQSTNGQGLPGMNVGWEFEFEPQSQQQQQQQQLPEFTQDGYAYNSAHNNSNGPYPSGSYNGQMYQHNGYYQSSSHVNGPGPLSLETVEERGSSEEADDVGRRYHETWVSSHA
ncbi:hypothetical protein FRB96_004793 [Tulasnella sp. 330]|nr:hypothetical protein FRB96_004793 [Tulasnella sp. 330]